MSTNAGTAIATSDFFDDEWKLYHRGQIVIILKVKYRSNPHWRGIGTEGYVFFTFVSELGIVRSAKFFSTEKERILDKHFRFIR